ncbi:sigma-54-dependent transcriptional regulator [Vibrio sp. 10N.261.51.F12]|uniref:sigma-54-dependent transcriptional regulator n=1 Tax=Vibrio sp. 10N.261.51.F12 TaxID=3229679 RepID=UPI003551149B
MAFFDPSEKTQSHVSPYLAFSALVVDDEVGMQTVLKKALRKAFGHVETAGSVEEAEELRLKHHYDLIILDINLPGRSGIEWEEAFSDLDRKADIIFMTGYADLDVAISALKLGASDFILKPFNLQQMLQAVQRCMDKRLAERVTVALSHDISRRVSKDLIGSSVKTTQLKQLISQFAPSKASVLIEGESGTGKELVARGLHDASKRQGPYVAINCGALAPELLESELFGHTAGAFTGAKKSREGLFRVASGGTLFLDEIGEMPLAMQASLLRVLEQRTVRPVGTEREVSIDVRVVAATNRNLRQQVEQGKFRQDLFYRLNVLKIEVPSLRSRLSDLNELVPYLTRRLAKELGVVEPKWAHEDMFAMQDYDWPGNVRELKNMLERCILLNKPPAHYFRELNGGPVNASITLSANDMSTMPAVAINGDVQFGYPDSWSLKDVEKAHIQQVMDFHSGNKSAASRDLGVARKTLERKYKEWDDNELSNES